MTDITDQDRRAAREWAEKIDPTYRGNSRPLLNAARVILATVDAPEPTLAEELAHITDHLQSWTATIITRALNAAAHRAKQTERDLAEARAEVDRLTAVNEEMWKTDNYREFRERFLTMQKGAESNAETPDPADVKPGEAWLVEVFGERRAAVKDRSGVEPWNTVPAGGRFQPEEDENVTLITRLVPAPRVITDHDGLDRAKRLTVIHDGVGVVCERAALGDGWFTTGNGVDQTPYIQFPATVIWEPEA